MDRQCLLYSAGHPATHSDARGVTASGQCQYLGQRFQHYVRISDSGIGHTEWRAVGLENRAGLCRQYDG